MMQVANCMLCIVHAEQWCRRWCILVMQLL